MLRAAILACVSLVFSSLVSAQSPPRPKIYGIAFVRIKSSDFQKSSESYSKILGLTSGTNGCVNVKNPCFVVNRVQHVELTHANANDSGSWLDQVAFRTSDVEQMRNYLRAQGLLVSEIETTPSGKPLVETEDPEGNHIAFVELARGEEMAALSPNQVSYRLFHAGFVVRDLPLMRHFYMDQLGFRLYWKGGFKDLPAGTPEKDSDIDWFEIQVPNGSDWVEFMLNIPANANHEELGVQNHFCLGVPNMEKALDQLHKNGLSPDSKFADDKSEIGRDGKWQFDIFDPDLTRIELMEPTPAKDPCCNPYTAPHAHL
jgi:catechol 2,3-dioxygenase-like lactoylglutathione lyase family enzyme/predicted enzyme related to lactoylglutathione lyase